MLEGGGYEEERRGTQVEALDSLKPVKSVNKVAFVHDFHGE